MSKEQWRKLRVLLVWMGRRNCFLALQNSEKLPSNPVYPQYLFNLFYAWRNWKLKMLSFCLKMWNCRKKLAILKKKMSSSSNKWKNLHFLLMDRKIIINLYLFGINNSPKKFNSMRKMLKIFMKIWNGSKVLSKSMKFLNMFIGEQNQNTKLY